MIANKLPEKLLRHLYPTIRDTGQAKAIYNCQRHAVLRLAAMVLFEKTGNRHDPENAAKPFLAAIGQAVPFLLPCGYPIPDDARLVEMYNAGFPLLAEADSRNRATFLATKRQFKLSAPKRCQKCGSDQHLQVDHIFPVSHYPWLKNSISNLQVLCRTCNIQKSNKEIVDYRGKNPVKKLGQTKPRNIRSLEKIISKAMRIAGIKRITKKKQAAIKATIVGFTEEQRRTAYNDIIRLMKITYPSNDVIEKARIEVGAITEERIMAILALQPKTGKTRRL